MRSFAPDFAKHFVQRAGIEGLFETYGILFE
jgi:hypothetical protein